MRTGNGRAGYREVGLKVPGIRRFGAVGLMLLLPAGAARADLVIDFSQIPPSHNAGDAMARFGDRAAAVINAVACSGYTLHEIYQDEENFGTHGLAKLATAIGQCPGETAPNVRLVADALLRSTVRSKTGTTIDDSVLGVSLPCNRTGEYDVALRALIPMLYRYWWKLDGQPPQPGPPSTADWRDEAKLPVTTHILHDLLTLRGGRDTSVEAITCASVAIPETENHLLNMGTSRYLTNQLLLAETQAQGRDGSAFDNERNGMVEFMLTWLSVLAQHDFGEYNARPYAFYSLSSLQNLYDFAEDPRVRNAAGVVLDYMGAKFAVGSDHLRRPSPYRRRAEFEGVTGLYADHQDAQTYRFTLYSGEYDGIPGWRPNAYAADDMLFAAVSGYRPPPALLDLAFMHGDEILHRISHNPRPGLLPVYKDELGGLEVYHRTAAFLLSAGGIQATTGHLGGENGTVLPTVLVPADFGSDRNDMIRFEPGKTNVCIGPGFACGINPQMPNDYVNQGQGCVATSGHWIFVNVGGACLGRGPHPFYAALFQETDHDQDLPFGLLDATPAGAMTFADFQQRVLRNGQSFQLTGANTYVTALGHRITFTIDQNDGATRKLEIDGADINADFGKWPLIAGTRVNSVGNTGALTVSDPRGHRELHLAVVSPNPPLRAALHMQPNGTLVQSSFGARGNFEFLTVQDGNLIHYWRQNDGSGAGVWRKGTTLVHPNPTSKPLGVSLLQGNGGTDPAQPDLLAVVRMSPLPGDDVNGYLMTAVMDGTTKAWRWDSLTVGGKLVTNITGQPALIQSNAGQHGNYELFVPQGLRVAHYWRDNDSNPPQWHEAPDALPAAPNIPGADVPVPVGVAAFQGSYGGNIEMVLRMRHSAGPSQAAGDYLEGRYRDARTGAWARLPILVDGKPIDGVTADPAFLQSAAGNVGDFEMVVPQGLRLVHYTRANDLPGGPWQHRFDIVEPPSPELAGVTMIESNYGTDATHLNLELLARSRTRDGTVLDTWFFDGTAGRWTLYAPPAGSAPLTNTDLP